MTFESFIVGKSNQLAFAAAERIAAAPAGSTPYNPLYLHAGVGLGKTHLLQAIAQEARRQGKRVAYFTADRFMYGFVAALKSQTALAFKEKLRGIDLLVVDDVQFIQGKSIQQEFGHTINALIDAGKQIVVAGDRLANDLEALDERIRSRLGGGLVVEVGDLDEELRAKILGLPARHAAGDPCQFPRQPGRRRLCRPRRRHQWPRSRRRRQPAAGPCHAVGPAGDAGDGRGRDPRSRPHPRAAPRQDRGHPEARRHPLQCQPGRYPLGAPHGRRGQAAPDRDVSRPRR